ncbi:MAG: leucine-rich repeat domain-containing protein [Planctomycetia bacterium]|nr:leucine-rich repeat domain-containing protein [Planctomycetia bacterium]
MFKTRKTENGITLVAVKVGVGTTKIEIPAEITDVTNFAFSRLYGSDLVAIHVSLENPFLKSVDGVLFSADGTVLYRCPRGFRKAEYVVPDGVTTIANQAFEGCRHLTAVTIPESVRSIGESAFSGSNLISVVIPEGVTALGKSAFEACRNLESVAISGSVSYIGESAFWYCDRLREYCVSAENSVYKSVDGVLFRKDGTVLYRCPRGFQKTEYTVPDGVTTIEKGAFWRCENLVSFTISESVRMIKTWALAQCPRLENVSILGENTVIEESCWGEDSLRTENGNFE